MKSIRILVATRTAVSPSETCRGGTVLQRPYLQNSMLYTGAVLGSLHVGNRQEMVLESGSCDYILYAEVEKRRYNHRYRERKEVSSTRSHGLLINNADSSPLIITAETLSRNDFRKASFLYYCDDNNNKDDCETPLSPM